MKQLKTRLKDGMGIFVESHKVYKKLQKHLDKQPIGFPATASGVERRILREVFTVKEADLALHFEGGLKSIPPFHNQWHHQILP